MLRSYICLFGLLISTGTQAGPVEQTGDNKPHIAIIIDDMGNRLDQCEQAIALPGDVTLNILPFTPYAKRLAELARKNHKEIMLHVPMESLNEHSLGYAGLRSDMNYNEFQQALATNLNYLSDIKGISNHMGSRLTQDEKMMDWLMSGLVSHGHLYFVDSMTTSKSIARNVARRNHISNAKRDVFLDHYKTEPAMQEQWQRLIHLAKRRGSAVAIGHPFKLTMDFLERHLPELQAEGIKLVRVSTLLEWRQSRRNYVWQTSLSHSPRAVKN